jgi:dihydroorotase-like cyclic amidohydrolase
VLDPLVPEARPAVRDIAIAGDRISSVQDKIEAPGARVVDARDMLAIPGLVSARVLIGALEALKSGITTLPLLWLRELIP